MNFKLVYGKSGSGKSTYLYENIKNIGKGCKAFFIVPEQSNLMTEQNLFKYTNKNTLMNIEVLTLSRMATRVEEELGVRIDTKLSNTGKSMIIYNLLNKYKSKLQFLGKTDKNVETVSQLITEFKKHNITPDTIKNLKPESEYQKIKLKDINLLYGEYEKILSNNIIDENDKLNILAENLESSNLLEDAYIYIDDFQGFTDQEFKVIDRIMNKCKELNVAITFDDLNILTKPENDLFYFNKVFAAKLIDMAEKKNAKIEKIKMDSNLRAKTSELKFLESNFGEIKTKQYTKNVKNISIYLANDIYDELEEIARKITYLVQKESYRYNEISIITQNIENYAEDAKAIFNRYNIPVFIDEKKKLNQNVIMQFILNLIEIFQKNWSYEAMFSFLKNDLLQIGNDNLYRLENYCRKYGVKGKKWQNEFNYEPANDLQLRLEEIRKKIVSILNRFKNEVQTNKTYRQMCTFLYRFLEENEIDEVLNKNIEKFQNIEIAEEYQTSVKVISNVLDEMILIFGDENISFEKFKELLHIGFENSELGKIPLLQDGVILGDTERSRNHQIKVLFIVGMNDGAFPKHSREEGFLNDSDRNFLRENGLSVAKDSTELLYDEQFNIYKTFSTPSEKLFISYCMSDPDGKSIRPSVTLKKIKRLFPELKEKSSISNSDYILANENIAFEEALKNYKDFLDGKEISDEWINIISYFYKKNPFQFENLISGYNYTNKAEIINDENLKKLYGNILRTSVSRIETYRKCPFSYHLTYGLKLKERTDLKLEAIDTGSFMHEVIENFFIKVQKTNKSIKEITEEEAKLIVNEIINSVFSESKYYIFNSSAKFRILTRKLKNVVLKSILYIIYSLKYSSFEPFGIEAEFGENAKYKPIVVELDNGNKVEITGKIDRVDIGKIDNNTYVRIIDYKSSVKKLDLTQVEAGLQIQLITYLDAIAEQEAFLPGGILYLGLIDSIKKADKNMTDEEIENDIKKSFKMQGIVLADIKVIKSMDNKLETGASDIIPVYLKGDGEISKSWSSVATNEEFKNLQKGVKDTIKKLSNEILKGNIEIKPYKYQQNTACDYCKYRTICMFDPTRKNNEYDYIGGILNDK